MCCSDNDFVAIAAPRGHAKSTAITFAYTLTCILFRERKFILMISDTEAQSALFLGNIKKEITMNEDLIHMFGVKLVKDSETDCIIEFEDGYQCRIIAKGSEQKLRGLNWNSARPDLIICDDIENDEIVLNSERRKKFKKWFTGALLPSRSREGVIRIVGTILHMDSLLEGFMPKSFKKEQTITTPLCDRTSHKVQWIAARYRAHPSINDFSQVLWSAYKPKEWLQAEQRKLRAQGQGDMYAQEYLNQPLDEANSLFARTDFYNQKPEDKGVPKNYYIGMDFALTLKTTSDYSAFVIGGVTADGNLHIEDVIRERLTSLEIVDKILELNTRYKPMFFAVEKGSITQSILPVLYQKMGEENNFAIIHTLSNIGQDKVQRCQSIRARMKAQKVRFDKDGDWFEGLELECMQFPRGRNDDQVDALSYLGLAINKFVEAPTLRQQEDIAYEEEVRESGNHEEGMSEWTGY